MSERVRSGYPDFVLSDDQQLLRDTARSLFTNECPPALVRAHIADPTAADPLFAHLRDFAALGDGALTDLCLFLQEHGYVAAPGPFFATTALFTPLLVALGHDLAGDALAGTVTGTVALAGADGRVARQRRAGEDVRPRGRPGRPRRDRRRGPAGAGGARGATFRRGSCTRRTRRAGCSRSTRAR